MLPAEYPSAIGFGFSGVSSFGMPSSSVRRSMMSSSLRCRCQSCGFQPRASEYVTMAVTAACHTFSAAARWSPASRSAMPSAKSWSAGESGRASASGVADASRSVPTGAGVVDGGSAAVRGGMVSARGSKVSGVMVIYAIIPARGRMRGLGCRVCGACGRFTKRPYGCVCLRGTPTGYAQVRRCGGYGVRVIGAAGCYVVGRCIPHSFASGSVSHHHLPARSSSPGLIARVHGAHPMLG